MSAINKHTFSSIYLNKDDAIYDIVASFSDEPLTKTKQIPYLLLVIG